MQKPARHFNRYTLQASIKNVYKDLEKIGVYISAQTLEHITDKVERLVHANKKNPMAVLLGFYVVVDGAIDKAHLKQVIQQRSKLSTPITEDDIIRYARLFLR